MSSTRTRVLIISVVALLISLISLAISDRSNAQLPDHPAGTGKLEGKCNCDLVEAVGCRGSYTPPPPPKKKPPLPPIKKRIAKNVYPTKAPAVPEEKDLEGINSGSGVAADTESNFEKGESNDREHRNPDGTMSKNGYYAERRRYIYNTYNYAQDQVGREGGITKDFFDGIQKALQDKLKKINEQEREAYQKELAVEHEAQLEDLNKVVDPQNETRTNQMLDAIDKVDLDWFEEGLEAALEQVIAENIGQAREQELNGGSGAKAAARARELVDKLLQKFAAECGKKKLKTTTIIAVERMAQLAGLDVAGKLGHCQTATAVAKLSVGGIEYEARKCLPPLSHGTERFEGKWKLKITGVMNGTGDILAVRGSGNWESNAFVAGGSITQDGPAELISGGNFCGIKLTSSNAVGMFEGYRVRMSGVSGILPIQIVNEKCSDATAGPQNP